METSLSNHSNQIGYAYTLFATLGIRNHDANGVLRAFTEYPQMFQTMPFKLH